MEEGSGAAPAGLGGAAIAAAFKASPMPRQDHPSEQLLASLMAVGEHGSRERRVKWAVGSSGGGGSGGAWPGGCQAARISMAF